MLSIGALRLLPLAENDFESILLPVFPRLRQIKAYLHSLGAEVSLLSGSGSTIFGVFADKDTAVKAMHTIKDSCEGQVFCVPTRSMGLSFSGEQTDVISQDSNG